MEDYLNSPIQPMSSENAEELISAFEKFNESAKHMNEAMISFNHEIRLQMAQQAVEKFLGYVEKYTAATFITRWWWKRKVFNMAEAVWQVSELINEEILCTHRQR